MRRTMKSAARQPVRSLLRWVAPLALVAASVPSAGLALMPCWPPPVTAPVTDPYREPECRWCPGNRGIEYATTPGASVRAVAAGVVTFAGVVAGERYVVVRVASGWRITYGGLRTAQVAQGDVVVARSVIGSAGRTLHFGVRIGARYVDPGPYVGRLEHVPRLVPVDGSPGAPAGPPRLRCGIRAGDGIVRVPSEPAGELGMPSGRVSPRTEPGYHAPAPR